MAGFQTFGRGRISAFANSEIVAVTDEDRQLVEDEQLDDQDLPEWRESLAALWKHSGGFAHKKGRPGRGRPNDHSRKP